MEKRMVLAIGLSLVILFGFQILGPKPAKVITSGTAFQQKSYSQEAGIVPTGSSSGTQETARSLDREIPKPEKTTLVKTDKSDMVFSDIGGSLKEIYVANGDEAGMEKELLYSQEDPTKRIFTLRLDALAGLDKAKFTLKEGAGFIEYSYIEEGWLKVTKKYLTDKQDYALLAEIKITNLSSGEMEMAYTMVGPGNIQQADGVSGRNFVEANALLDGKIWKLSKAKGQQKRDGSAKWIAMKSRYYGIIMKPGIDTRSVTVKDEGKDNLLTEIELGGWKLFPGTEIKQEYVFYSGPLNEKTIAAVSSDMTPVVNYGFFGGVSKVLLAMLRFFYGVTRNWGISIILLTFTVNLALFPLAMKSFVSMHQMKKIQPHIMKLKELHKDNPQKLNKETMELYKKNNVNPLGGCLPLLLQMPIFIALYQGLIRSIELKGASFLWIKDLAKPDAVPIPATLPVIGNSINILPLLMVIMMAVQQKMTQASSAKDMTEEQKSQQKMMMLMMPVIFGFMFYNMPSGLVLYWLTNTILMTTGQKIISGRLEA